MEAPAAALLARQQPTTATTTLRRPTATQIPVVNVFVRDGDQLRHTWATELMFAPRDEGEDARHVDSIWPIWNVLDMTPAGRESDEEVTQLQDE